MQRRIITIAFIVACLMICSGCTKSITTPPAAQSQLDTQSGNVTEPSGTEMSKPSDLAAAGSADDVLPQSPLDIQIEQPVEGQILNQQEIQVVGRTAPGAVVTINDQIIVADEKGNFEIQLSLESGFQVIEIEASNSLGEDKILELTVDIEPE